MPNQTTFQDQLSEIIELALQKEATDIHLSVDNEPMLRIDGDIAKLPGHPPLKEEDTEGYANVIIPEERRGKFLENKDIDLSFHYRKKARFRVNIYHQLGSISIAMRYLPNEIQTIDDLKLPEVCYKFTKANQGFFLVVGPSGQGKSTALAAILNEINYSRAEHIITIEDPVEYLFPQDGKSIIEQRELGKDVKSFKRGLREAFRQDPDVIMLGEMRDAQTISSAVTAAETGHLVMTTLHTNTAAQTINRIIDSFPPHQQGQIRTQLAANIVGVLSRRLVPTKDGGLINAVEVMIANSAIRNLIREKKTHQIHTVIETSSDEGMISLNRSLAGLVNDNKITLEQAQRFSNNPAELGLLLK